MIALERVPFETSRLMDFFSEKELVAQCGHERSDWPLVALKELVDNALDACEDAAIPPRISVTVNDGGITVADRGPGIPAEVVAGIVKFDRKVSSREAYVSPCRGAQGNAGKVIAAMPFVLSGGTMGRTVISARGVRHEIAVWVDRIAQQPVVDHRQTEDRKVKTGTSVTVDWPVQASSILADQKARFLLLADDFTWLNPHLRLKTDWHGERRSINPSDPGWKKWLPRYPTSPHWYGVEHLERLAAAYLSHSNYGPDMPLRDFLRLFDGFSGSAKLKLVTDQVGLTRQTLGALLLGQEAFDPNVVALLLKAMRQHSRPIKPQALGIIGRQHFAEKCAALDCDLETFKYKRLASSDGGTPWIAEVAFATRNDESASARLITGVNWSPTIPGNDPFKNLGNDTNLSGLLSSQWIEQDSPVVLVVHVVIPRAQFFDRGKGRCDLG